MSIWKRENYLNGHRDEKNGWNGCGKPFRDLLKSTTNSSLTMAKVRTNTTYSMPLGGISMQTIITVGNRVKIRLIEEIGVVSAVSHWCVSVRYSIRTYVFGLTSVEQSGGDL